MPVSNWVFGHHHGHTIAIHLPRICRLLVRTESVVQRFARYHKYTVGTDLRTQAMQLTRCWSVPCNPTAYATARAARLCIGLFSMHHTVQHIPQLQLFDRKIRNMKIKHLLASLLLPLSSCVLAEPFTVSADGQDVTDLKTGFVWRRCAEGMTASGGTCTGTPSAFTHEAALTHASTQARNRGVACGYPT